MAEKLEGKVRILVVDDNEQNRALALLDISKSEEGRLAPSPCKLDVPALLGCVFEALEVRAQAKSISLDSHVEASTARAEADLLRRAVESIFERFVQVESGELAAARSGRGLGLAFCRLAVEAHGGRIGVEDGAPGAVFCLRLPHGS